MASENEVQDILGKAVGNIVNGTIDSDETKKSKDELNELKKEMATHIIDKMREKKTSFALLAGKDAIVDYLVDEGGLDVIRDWLWEQGIGILSDSSDQLGYLREQIQAVDSKEKLSSLESSILNEIEQTGDLPSRPKLETGDTPQSPEGGHAVIEEQDEGDNGIIDEGTSIESAAIGQAKEIPLGKRMKWLFPNGTPKKESEMLKYTTTIEVPIVTANGKEINHSITVHKKLANEYLAVFKDLKKAGIKINPETTACYIWRTARKSTKLSHHSFGSAIDVNWNVNGGVYGKTDENSPYFNNQTCVNIRKSHGFYRGGDWKKHNNDPMHFTYMNA